MRRYSKNPRKALIQRVKRKAQLYARLRDCGGYSGGTECISCGVYHKFEELDGGHGIAATHSAIMFDERNINAQCRHCNRFLHGNERNYYHGMIRKYGQEVVDELEAQEHLTKKWTAAELKELDAYYTQKIAEYKTSN